MFQESPSQVVAVTVVFYALALLLYTLRIWTRYKAKFLGLDDVLFTVSVIGITDLFICNMVLVHNGLGQHIDTLSEPQLVAFFKALFAQFQGYDWGIAFLKLGLSWQLYRIKGNSLIWRWFLWSMMAANIIVLCLAEFIDYLEYKPFNAQWDFSIKPEYRISPSIVLGGWSLFLCIWFPLNDALFAVLPIFFLWKLHRPLPEKIMLIALMALGLTCFAVTIPRLVGYFTKSVTEDVTYTMSSLVFLSTMEVLIGFCGACIPTLRRPFENALAKFESRFSSSRSSNAKASSANRFAWAGFKTSEKSSNHGFTPAGSEAAVSKPSPVASMTQRSHDETWLDLESNSIHNKYPVVNTAALQNERSH